MFQRLPLLFLTTVLTFTAAAQPYKGHIRYGINYEGGFTYSKYNDAITGFVGLKKLERQAIRDIDAWTSTVGCSYEIIRIDREKAGLGITPKVNILFEVSGGNPAPVSSNQRSASSSVKTAEVKFRSSDTSHSISNVAVIPISDGVGCDGEIKDARDLATYTEMSLLDNYGIVDRELVEQTLSELSFQMSGLTLEQGVLKGGCMLNASGYVFVSYGCFEQEESITVKLIHCESGENVWIAQGFNSSARDVLEEIVSRLE